MVGYATCLQMHLFVKLFLFHL